MQKAVKISLPVKLALFAAVLGTSACAVLPVQERPQERQGIPNSLPSQFRNVEKLFSKAVPTWEESFPSAHLRADVRTLAAQNFELKAARARVEQAAALYGVARSALFPSLGASADFDRSRIKEEDEETAAETKSTLALGAAFQWEPDLWGRLKFRKEAAARSIEERQALADHALLGLQAMLVESWIAHHTAREREQILSLQRKTNEAFLRLTEIRLGNGQGGAPDVLRQRRRLAASERALPSVRSAKYRSANAYAVLLGQAPVNQLLPEEPWPPIQRLSALPSPRALLSDRPDLRAAFSALRAADMETAAAVADRLPRVSVGISLGWSGSGISGIGDGSLLRFASGLLAPVFEAGRLKANAARRAAEAREALAILEQKMREAVRDVENAVLQEQALFEEQSLLADEMAAARATVEQATLRHGNGQESFLSVLLARDELQTLQQQKIQLQKDLLLNRSRLLTALGAKWRDRRESP